MLTSVGTFLTKFILGRDTRVKQLIEASRDKAKLDKRKVKKMKPAQLKEELKLRGLSIQGNAKELVARLTEAAC